MLPVAASGKQDKIGGTEFHSGGVSKSVRSCGHPLFAPRRKQIIDKYSIIFVIPLAAIIVSGSTMRGL